MDISVILSGFIGSFLGVISGFLGAVYLDWRRNARERRTHILALRREILSNNVRVQVLLKDGRREGALDDRAWRELRVPLAGDLPADIYNRIASRYDTFTEVRRAYDDLGAGSDLEEGDRERLSKWADGMMVEHDRMSAEVEDREEGLLRALRRKERRREADQNSSARYEA